MLVCPHCQFENPDTHNFCQKCGGSLTEKECPACQAPIAVENEHCPHCGIATGTIWKVIFAPQAELSAKCLESPTLFTAPKLPNQKYLDPGLRYELLSPSSDLADAEVRVLDRQPLQSSPLEICNNLYGDSTLDFCQAVVPAIARPYLELRDRYPSLPLPQVHDAWNQDGLEILLLEDWATLPPLLKFWEDEQVLPLQILHWLHEMIELWAVLETQHCCQSLLILDNLRVDEDGLLCLQQLYADRSDQSPSLRELGRLWQMLFQQSQRTQRGDLATLYSDLEAGRVDSLEQLRSRIEAIATTLQSQLHTQSGAAPAPLNPFMIEEDVNLDGKAFSCLFDPTDPVTAPLTPGVVPPPMVTELENYSAEPPSAQSAAELEQPVSDSITEPPTLSDEESLETDDLPTIVLPMRLLNLEDAGATDIGRQRDHNEDCFSIQTQTKKLEGFKGRSLQAKGLYILCDGMGGHAGGEVASALAVETLQTYFAQHWQDKLPNYETIREAVHQANQAIYDRNQENARSGSGRMGTTLVLVLIQDTEAAIAHVGDSRLYRFSRRQGLEPLTVDHEVGQREIQRGVEPAIAYARPDAYQLTQALGPRDENFVSPDIQFFELNEDLLLLLCSDGLTDNNLLETHWQTHLEPLLNSQTSLEQGVHQLIDLANQQNGHDNITAIAIRTQVRPDLDQLSRP